MEGSSARPAVVRAPADAQEHGPPLRAVGLTKRYGQRLAVRDLNLEVRRGDVFGLLGPNGSGKTTTLRMALGLVAPTQGEVALFGVSVGDTGRRRALLRRVGALIEQPAFYPYLSGRDNLRMVATLSGVPGGQITRSRIDAVLAQVELADRSRDAYQKYSLGMKQRLGIAAALLTEPELIILDEPTNGLDPAGIVDVRALIGRLASQGMTIVLSSHQLYEVQQICSRVAILNLGTTVAQGEVAELLAAQTGLVVGFDQPDLAARAMAALQEAAGGETPWLRGAKWVAPELGAWVPPGGWLIAVDAPVERASEICALLARQGLYPAELRRREGSLEQFFLALTGGQNGEAQGAPEAVRPSTQGGAR